jgi:hypothetical protein
MAAMACSKPGPTSAQPISSSGPTESSGLAVVPADDRVSDVQGQGGEAGEDEQSAGGPELVRRRAVQREVTVAQQEPEDGQVDRRRHERRDSRGNAKTQGQVKYVAEAEQEGQPNDRAHDHGHGPDDNGLVSGQLRRRGALRWSSGVTALALDLRSFRQKPPDADRLDRDLRSLDEDQRVRIVPR